MGRLRHTGSSVPLRRALFPGGFAAEVMEIVWGTWKQFALHHDVTLEPRITALFRSALIDAYVAQGRSWFITLEDPVTDPTFGSQDGRNDLNFYPAQHHGQRIFFTLECKRLNVTTVTGFRHNADKYVSEGVQRFVDGVYSAALPCGGMLGYVMDSRSDLSMKRIEAELNARMTELKLSKSCPWRTPSIKLPDCAQSADTVHDRASGDFTVHHILVDVARK